METEDAYQNFCRAIESVNVIIATYKDELMGALEVSSPCRMLHEAPRCEIHRSACCENSRSNVVKFIVVRA